MTLLLAVTLLLFDLEPQFHVCHFVKYDHFPFHSPSISGAFRFSSVHLRFECSLLFALLCRGLSEGLRHVDPRSGYVYIKLVVVNWLLVCLLVYYVQFDS